MAKRTATDRAKADTSDLSNETSKLTENMREFGTVAKDALDTTIVTQYVNGLQKAKDYLNTGAQAMAGIASQFDNLNKSLGVSNNLSANFSTQLAKVQVRADGIARSFKEYQQALIAMQELMPGTGKILIDTMTATDDYSNSIVQLQSDMISKLQLTSKEASEVSQYLLAMTSHSTDVNHTFSNTADELAQTALVIENMTGETGILRDLFTQLGNLSASTRITLSGNVSEIAKAALAANRLGTSMNDITRSADDMLDIESSIGAELELQQLTGDKIIASEYTNRIRIARLTGDETEMVKARYEFFKKYADELTNPLVLNAAAKAFGTDASQFAKEQQHYKARASMLSNLQDAADERLSTLQSEGKTITEARDQLANELNIKVEDIGNLTIDMLDTDKFQAGLQKLASGNEQLRGAYEKSLQTSSNLQTVEDRLITAIDKLAGAGLAGFGDSVSETMKTVNVMAQAVGDLDDTMEMLASAIDNMSVQNLNTDNLEKTIKTLITALQKPDNLTDTYNTVAKAIKDGLSKATITVPPKSIGNNTQ